MPHLRTKNQLVTNKDCLAIVLVFSFCTGELRARKKHLENLSAEILYDVLGDHAGHRSLLSISRDRHAWDISTTVHLRSNCFHL